MSGMQSTAERPERRRSLRWRTLLASGAVTTGAVVLGISGGGATYAFLNASATLDTATVSAGTLAITANDSVSAQLGAKTLSPATPVAWPITVRNDGAAPARLSARINVGQPAPAYAAPARALITTVNASADCTAGTTGTPAALNGYTAPDLGRLAPAGQRTYCLVISLPDGTAATGSGQPLNFTVTIDATQDAS